MFLSIFCLAIALCMDCHSRALNNKTNRLHERCLRVIYKEKVLTFEELFEKACPFSKYIKDLQILTIDMYKVVNGGSHEITKLLTKKTDIIWDIERPSDVP